VCPMECHMNWTMVTRYEVLAAAGI
jgi:hypothetical protein